MWMWNERRTTNWCSMENAAAALKQPLLLLRINDVNSLAKRPNNVHSSINTQMCSCLYKTALLLCILFSFRKRTSSSSSSSAWTKAISIESCHSNYTGRFTLFASRSVAAIVVCAATEENKKHTILNIAFITRWTFVQMHKGCPIHTYSMVWHALHLMSAIYT